MEQEITTRIKVLEKNRSFDKFSLYELEALSRAEYNLKYGKKLSNYQRFIHTAYLYFCDIHVPDGISDQMKVAAKRYIKCWN
jgi:hypothetical protein